jgi:hypothetical protein
METGIGEERYQFLRKKNGISAHWRYNLHYEKGTVLWWLWGASV